MSDTTTTKLVPLKRLLDALFSNTNVTLADHSAVGKALAAAAVQHGVQPKDLHVVEVTREVAGKKVRSYDVGFTNTDPSNVGDVITITESNSRVWQPISRANQVESLLPREEEEAVEPPA